MKMLSRLLWFALVLCLPLVGSSAFAVQPDEVLDDPVLEQRARDLSAELRCMVCQNQSIDDSEADLARDLRILVRDRLKAGDDDREVIDYIVARYGEFVLLKPRFNVRNAMLWATPALLLLIGGSVIYVNARSRRRGGQTNLSDEEQAKLDEILKGHK